jgi:hypothetical protein
MIEFISISTISFISILSLGKIINYNLRFDYFISTILLTFISLICLTFQINFLLIVIKILLVFIFFFLLIKKKIKIEKFDYIYLISFVFLIYFNFNDFFRKTDVLSGYGYQIKVIFLNSKLPHLDEITNFIHYNLEFLQSLYFNYFITGLFNFREDVIILSQNLFLIICFVTIIKPTDLKNWNKISNIIKLFIIFYLLISIFLQNGKNILAEDFNILFIFGLTIFIIENIKKFDFKSSIFLIICFFLLGLSKKAVLFLLIFPLGILILNNKAYKNAVVAIILISSLIFSYNFSQNLNTEIFEKSQNYNFYKFSSIEDLKTKSIKAKKYEIKDEHKYFKYSKNNFKLKDFYTRINYRYAAYQEDKKSFIKNLNNIVSKGITNIEIYKASFLPPVRYLTNKLNLDYKFPRLSIILYYWILFIFFLYFYIFLNSRKIFKRKFGFNKYLILTAIIICTNIILVFEDLLIHAESIDIENNSYSFKLNPTDRDSSRYLGWSIIFSILFSLYFAKKQLSSKFSKYINIILITLILITPARSFGHLIKIDKGKKEEINLGKLYNKFRTDIRKSCDQNIPIIIFDNDYRKHSFVKFMYHFYDYQFIQFYVNKNDQKFIEVLNYKNMTNNIGCLIVNDNLPIKLLIDENFVYKSFKVTGNNHETLDYTVYLFNM